MLDSVFWRLIKVGVLLKQPLAMPVVPAERDRIIDVVDVFVRVSRPTETDRLTDRDRQTETRLSPVNNSSRLREHKLLVPGSASAGCCRAGRVLMTHFSHVCLDVCLNVCLSVVYVCMRMFSLYSVRAASTAKRREYLARIAVVMEQWTGPLGS